MARGSLRSTARLFICVQNLASSFCAFFNKVEKQKRAPDYARRTLEEREGRTAGAA